MYARTEEFTETQQALASMSKLLSHPARIAIIELLAQERTCMSGNIASKLPLSRPTVSQHFQELKRAGAIIGEVDGQRVCYCLNPDYFNRLQPLMRYLFAEVDRYAAGADQSCCKPGDGNIC